MRIDRRRSTSMFIRVKRANAGRATPSAVRITAAAVLLLLSASIPVLGQAASELKGVVTDQHGAAVPGAGVRFVPEGTEIDARTVTDDEGRFRLTVTPGSRGTLTVDAPGFAVSEQRWNDGRSELTVVLFPAAIGGTVNVTGAETRLEETPASVALLERRDLENTAAATLDDKLRQVPGFSLFRRAGSRTANPTTQGVSLRGVGATGASRALVLANDIPLNDAFGGWIYWGRVPSASISQVEVLRGPASEVYGSSAIGGVVSIVTRPAAAEPSVTVDASLGDQETSMVSGFASAGISDLRVWVAGESFRTGGYIPVDRSVRGPVDTTAGVRRLGFMAHIEALFGKRHRLFTGAETYEERRTNGTPLQTNDTRLGSLNAGADIGSAADSLFTLRSSIGRQSYHQSFSAVAGDRSSESLTRIQSVPSQVFGLSGKWSGSLSNNVIYAEADMREVRGRTDETGFAAGSPTAISSAGGREFTSAFSIGGSLALRSYLKLSGGVRYDRWSIFDGRSSMVAPATGASTVTRFPDRGESMLSPRASLLLRAGRNVYIAATFARSFRRPTLNELYRSFRVGNVVTMANEDLRAERATSGEIAAAVTGFGRRLHLRGGLFCTVISDTVSNVTLSVTPGLIVRRRQNLGKTRSCGIEADIQARPAENFRISGGYLFVDPRSDGLAAGGSVEDRLIPQVPRHQFSLLAEYSDPALVTAAVQLRGTGAQFDDDQNLFRLKGFITADLIIARPLRRGVDVYAAIENLFDTDIEAGRTPVLTLAAPRTFRIGFRFNLRRR